MTNLSSNSIKIKLDICGVKSLSNMIIYSTEDLMSILKKDNKIFDDLFYGMVFSEIKDIIVKEFNISSDKIHKNTSISLILSQKTRINKMDAIAKKTKYELPLLTTSFLSFVITIVSFIITIYFCFSFVYDNQEIIFVVPGFLRIGMILFIGLIPSIVLYTIFPRVFERNKFDRISTFDDFIIDIVDLNTEKSEELIIAYFNSPLVPACKPK